MSSAKKIRYIYDEKGKATDLVLSVSTLKSHEDLEGLVENLIDSLEDLIDSLDMKDRRNEQSIPFSEIKKRRKKKYG